MAYNDEVIDFFHQDVKSLIIQLAPSGGLKETFKIPIFPSIVIIKFKEKKRKEKKKLVTNQGSVGHAT